jgi:hypothetical protein
MRSALAILAVAAALGTTSLVNAQTFLSPGALKDGTYGFFGPGEPMSLPTQGRSVSTEGIRGECKAGDIVRCYPATYGAIADVAGQ